ncbi:MAG TPA: AMP-binding protein [Polyangiaceae bacterium]|nr:AMP-binding protein [Polyangiaceae bacterium]
MTTPSLLFQRFHEVTAAHGARTCTTDAAGSVTFREVAAAADRLARALLASIPAHSRVALFAPASREWVQGFWGVALSGNLIVPLVEIHPAAEHARSLAAARVQLLLVSRELRARADEAVALLASLQPALAPPRVVELEPLLAGETKDVARPDLKAPSGDTPVVLFFTSGTTGEPKGALVSHDQLAALTQLVGEAWRVAASDRLLHCLPLHHTHGLSIAFLVCFLSGASQHFLRRFSSEAVWQELGSSTLFMGVPTMHKRLLDGFAAQPVEVRKGWREAARELRLVTSGSAALPESVALGWRAIADQLPLERFGMTEVGVALSNPLDGERRVGSCGRVLPGMQVRIVDESGNDAAPGEPGEIWIRGPSVFVGYDADAAATEAAFTDGWFRSGDTATWLPGGYVKILGRTSVDIIKSGGYKLSALEIEEALRRHSKVDEVAVLGVPDADWGETAVAVIVGREPIDAVEIREFLKQEVAPYKIPRRFVQVDELPKNALGKVTKHTLRRLL